MPSPIGHAIAGTAVAWTADIVDGRRSSGRLLTTCALLATTADLDLIWPPFHRQATHSLIAVLMVFIIAAAVTGRVTDLRATRFGGQARWRVALVCAIAYGTHLLLDWLAVDKFPPAGIQLLWPFVRRYFISGWDLFAQTERRDLLAPASIDQNVRAVAQELLILAPIAAALWLVRKKALARLPPEMSRRDHAAP